MSELLIHYRKVYLYETSLPLVRKDILLESTTQVWSRIRAYQVMGEIT